MFDSCFFIFILFYSESNPPKGSIKQELMQLCTLKIIQHSLSWTINDLQFEKCFTEAFHEENNIHEVKFFLYAYNMFKTQMHILLWHFVKYDVILTNRTQFKSLCVEFWGQKKFLHTRRSQNSLEIAGLSLELL